MNQKFPYRFRVLVLLFFLIIITFLDRNCIGLVSKSIKDEFHLSNEQFGWVLAAFSLAYALFEIPTGMLGDRIGQRSVLIRIVIWWSLFTVLTGMTTGLASLIIIRFLFGMGEAGVFPTSTAIISRWFPFTETGRSIGVINLAINAGSAIAPLLIVPIASNFGWRTTFFVNGFIGLLWVAVCYIWFRNHPSQMKQISKTERDYIEAHRRFQKHGQVFSLRAALKTRNMRALSAIHFCDICMFYFLIAWLPVYLTEGRHFTAHEMKFIISAVFVAGVVAIIIGGFFSDWLVKRKGLSFGRRFLGIISLGGGGAALAITAIVSNNLIIIVSLIVANLIYTSNGISSFSTCVDIGRNYAGSVTGIMNFCGQMGGLLLSLSFGKLADLTHSFQIPVLVVAAVCFTGSMLWFLVDPQKQIMVQEKKTVQELELATTA